MTVAEAAAALGISTCGVYMALRMCALAGIRKEGRWTITAASVEAYRERCENYRTKRRAAFPDRTRSTNTTYVQLNDAERDAFRAAIGSRKQAACLRALCAGRARIEGGQYVEIS